MSSLSLYEQQRLATIAGNHAKLVELGIEKDIAAIRSASVKTVRAVKGAAANKRSKPEGPPPRQRSLRLQNLDADGQELPDKDAQPSPTPEPVKKVRRTSAPLDASKVTNGLTDPEEAATFLGRLGPLLEMKTPGKTKKVKAEPKPVSLDLSSLGVDGDDIAKLVPERIFSMAVHPSSAKLLVAAGDTWGRVGLWDVDAGDDLPVVTFAPHDRPVAGMRMLANAPHQLISCSHDGAVRCLDLGGGASASFVELYRCPEDSDGDYPTLHGLSRELGEGGALAACRNDGGVVLLDPRTPGANASVLQLHEKKVFSVDFSPTRPWLLATGSLDRTVALWDVRACGEKLAAGGKGKLKPLSVLEHGLSVTAARFSADGGRMLTTCNDNLLRVFEDGTGGGWAKPAGEPICAVKHNNNTGRYLTPFQAEWLPRSNDVFVCGSLGQPRGLDVLRCDGAHMDRMEHDNISAVLSLVACHPTLPVLVAENASGKCFVWR